MKPGDRRAAASATLRAGLAFSLLLGPPSPLVALALGLTRLSRRPGWPEPLQAALWLALALPAGLARLAAGDLAGAWGAFGVGAAGLVSAHLLRLGHRPLRVGALAALLVMVALAGAERWLGARSWAGPDGAIRPIGLTAAGPDTRLTAPGEPGGGTGRDVVFTRSCDASGTGGSLELEFEARLAAGWPGWDWRRSDPAFDLRPVDEGDGAFTRVRSPHGGDPYLYRQVDTNRPLAGRTFRVQLQLRSSTPGPAGSCQGVWLQEGGGDHPFRCLPTALGPTWRSFSLVWTAPPSAQSRGLLVVLNDFDGLTFDVRRVELAERTSGRWTALGPLDPTGLTLRLARPPAAPVDHPLAPAAGWTRYRLGLDPPAGGGGRRVEAQLLLAPGLSLETRGVRLLRAGGGPALSPGLAAPRATLWFPHPNLLGHSLAATGMLYLLVSPGGPVGLAGLGLSLLGIALTGSRAAWLGGAAGLLSLAWLGRPPGPFRFWLIPIGLGLAWLTAFGGDSLGRLADLSTDSPAPRPEIWRLAWEATLEHPWTGMGRDAFGAYFAHHSGATGAVLVPHAHNLWLDFSSSYGLPGLAGAVAFSIGLAALGWRRGQARGLALVLFLLLMNVLDDSLLFTGVAYPLFLGLNALDARAPEPPTLEPGSRGGGSAT